MVTKMVNGIIYYTKVAHTGPTCSRRFGDHAGIQYKIMEMANSRRAAYTYTPEY